MLVKFFRKGTSKDSDWKSLEIAIQILTLHTTYKTGVNVLELARQAAY